MIKILCQSDFAVYEVVWFGFFAEALAGGSYPRGAESCNEPDSTAMVWQRFARVSVELI